MVLFTYIVPILYQYRYKVSSVHTTNLSNLDFKTKHIMKSIVRKIINKDHKDRPAAVLPSDQLAAAARLSWMLSWRVTFERRDDCFWIRSRLRFTFWSSWSSSSILAELWALWKRINLVKRNNVVVNLKELARPLKFLDYNCHVQINTIKRIRVNYIMVLKTSVCPNLAPELPFSFQLGTSIIIINFDFWLTKIMSYYVIQK